MCPVGLTARREEAPWLALLTKSHNLIYSWATMGVIENKQRNFTLIGAALAFITIADLYPPRERGKISGALGAVFGLASIFGPLVVVFD